MRSSTPSPRSASPTYRCPRPPSASGAPSASTGRDKSFNLGPWQHMRLRNVTFSSWLNNHGEKAVKVRWLRELYPWPVLAQVDCDPKLRGRAQQITHDGAE